jgi:arylformamidase
MRIIDLSHKLQPREQRFRLELQTYPVNEYVPGYQVAEGEWYVMQELTLCTHVGTHVEAPYHALKNGLQVGDMDMSMLIGPASVIDFTDKKHNDPLMRSEAEERGRHVQRNDIVLIRTGLSRHYGTPRYKRPYLETEMLEWLIERGVKCLGIDCSGIENKQINSKQVNHRKLFSNGIPLIEDMNNLDKIREKRVFFIALTLPVKGLDASPVRPLAFEPLAECEEMAKSFANGESIADFRQ